MTTATLEAPALALPNTTELAPAGEITLTPGQDAAMTAIVGFLLDPDASVFVLSGYSGTGKSTLVRTVLNRLPGIIEACKIIHANLGSYTVQLTATTNKAAENFAHLTGRAVSTIQSYLGLMVRKDWDTNKNCLVPGKAAVVKEHILLFIDEATFIDNELLRFIWRYTNRCKIIFMGDPAQLLNPGSSTSPVFNGKYQGAQLTEVMRAPGGSTNPITELATKFRHMVDTGERFQFTPDGQHIQWLDQDAFENEIIKEFCRPDWGYHDSKILAWTNACVIAYNKAVRDCAKGSPNFHVGDYAVCNSYVAGEQGRGKRVKTDQTVYIKGIGEPKMQHGVSGRNIELDAGTFFVPDSLAEWKAIEKALHNSGEYEALQKMEATFMDLRAAYACTINKSQGSTFDRVFIDLNDVGKCLNQDLLARMLYVGVSRARHQVFLTGDTS